ncbi:hypothetical protein [Butyrivibrio sp. LB2008]|uniref:hypothetical protein n=1 Tax=Butyrivibrio sp. LB2008 TaxID=1408305 RepID=UPI00047B7519|nr:hypothetical protein [Butyrivibrio sp. LB2008]
MAIKDKQPEQIGTTDKLKAFKALKDAGYRTEFSASGVPTVICNNAEDIDKELKSIKKLLKELRYNGSFGVRAPRKSDQLTQETAETEEKKELTA